MSKAKVCQEVRSLLVIDRTNWFVMTSEYI